MRVMLCSVHVNRVASRLRDRRRYARCVSLDRTGFVCPRRGRVRRRGGDALFYRRAASLLLYPHLERTGGAVVSLVL